MLERTLIGLTVFIIVSQLIDLAAGLSNRFDIWDQILHFFGGVWVAAIFLYFFKVRPHLFEIKKSFLLTAIFALAFVALVGVLWEFFEYFMGGIIYNDFRIGTAAWGLDTLADLFLDLAGGFIMLVFWLLL